MNKRLLSLLLALALLCAMLPTALADAVSAPFTLEAGEVTALNATGYTPYGYDENWQSVPLTPVPLYTVKVPDGAKSVTLTFTQNVLAYNYGANAQYLYGEYDNTVTYTGVTTVTVPIDSNGDNVADYIQVQNPYTYNAETKVYGGGEVIYAITFTGSFAPWQEPAPTEPDATAGALLQAIAASYAAAGPDRDSNTAWIVADMAAYARRFPDGAALTDAQKQDAIDYFIDQLESGNDLAKSIIALAALGCDPTRLTTASGQSLDAVDKLTEEYFDEAGDMPAPAYFEYTLPYVILAYRQLGDAYRTQLDKAVETAVAIQDRWLGTTWGVDAISPMLLALAPWYESDASVKAAVDAGIGAIRSYSNASHDAMDNAASYGLAIAGLTAVGVDLATVTHNSQDLVTALLSKASGDSFGDATYNEQGFRGLLALSGGTGYQLYDFSDTTLAPAAATQYDLTFSLVPGDATVTLRDSAGTAVTPVQSACYRGLASGEVYTYEVSAAGYTAKRGTVTFTGEAQTVNVSLSREAPAESATVTVTVRVLAHDGDTCNNSLTYKGNPAQFTSLLPTDGYRVTLERGVGTARDALVAALDAGGVSYTEQSNGYFSTIGAYTELTHGGNSGWLYMINGTAATTAAQNTTFSANSTMIWWFTDDYTAEYGSEPWSQPTTPTTPSTPEPADTAAVSDSQLAAGEDVTLTVNDTAVTIPAEALAELAGDGQINLRVTTPAQGETKIEVKSGDTVVEHVPGGIAVTIPVSERPDKVLAVVDADGNETVVKKSVVSDGTVSALLEGSCTVKLIDNGKTFCDTENWASEAIDFVTSHELFQGVGGGRFAPGTAMSRAMLATVLYRLEDAVSAGESAFADVPAGAWYADAAAWAGSQGIVNGLGGGFAPKQNVTRQQLAVMLYRYAALTGMDTGIEGDVEAFSDAAEISAWASDAVRWAVGLGLLQGKDGGLDPKGDATRAEVAAMLQRLVTRMVS